MFDPSKPKSTPSAGRVQPAATHRAVTWAACKAAATRSANWARSELEAPGFVPDLLALHKATVAFDLAGQFPTTGLLLRAQAQQLPQVEDLQTAAPEPMAARGPSAALAWLAWGAQRVGAYQLSRPLLDRLEGALHPDMWGVPQDGSLPAAQRLYDLGSNASALNAMLAAGRLASAEKIGGFMAGLIVHHDTNATRVLLAADAQGQLLSHGLPAFEIGAPDQHYGSLGFALRGFAQLYRATGHKVWLEPAERIGEWLTRSHGDHATLASSAPLAWGAAELFAASGRQDWADLALRLTGQMLATQRPDGSWPHPDRASAAGEPLDDNLADSLAKGLDGALERVVYLCEIPRALALGGQPLP